MSRKKKQKQSFDEWKKETDKICVRRTGCDWNDLCGDEEPLQSAYDEGMSPNDFVTWVIEKHDLEDLEISPWGIRSR